MNLHIDNAKLTIRAYLDLDNCDHIHYLIVTIESLPFTTALDTIYAMAQASNRYVSSGMTSNENDTP